MAQVRPLNHFGNRQNPMPEHDLTREPRNTSRQTDSTSHSARTESESVHYHARHFGGRPSSARVTDQLDPDRSVSRANRTGRSFPGL